MKLAPAILIAFVGCGGKTAPAPIADPPTEEGVPAPVSETPTYYQGAYVQLTPDGEVRTSKPLLLQRTLRVSTHEVVEILQIDTLQIPMTFAETEDEGVFTLVGDVPTNTRTFHGPAWAWTSFDDDYQVNGGHSTGHGEITSGRIVIEEQTTKDGKTTRSRQTLEEISEDEYLAKRIEMGGE